MKNDYNGSKNIHVSRRTFVQTIGSAGVMGSILSGFPNITRKASAQTNSKDDLLGKKPNMLFLITDQQRYPQYWPDDFMLNTDNFPSWNRLQQNGLTFQRGFCNSAMCSPSRATLFSGLYPKHHGVIDTLTESENFMEQSLPKPVDIQNMAQMLASAGYHVVYKGKWHLSEGPNNELATQADLESYGFYEWDTREAGQDRLPENFGIRDDVDSDYVAKAVDFLNGWNSRNDDRPFALIISLVNPHDVLAYPESYHDAEENKFDYLNDTFDIGISLPPTVNEDLTTKPSAHAALVAASAPGLGPLITPIQKSNYVNFYAQLQIEVDRLLDQVLDALEANGLADDTVTFRLSDHGEMGLSHGGMRQKAFNIYEETINVPIIIHNRHLFPNAEMTNSLASLIDIMPTVAELAHVPDMNQWVFRGNNLMPIVHDPTTSVQDTILFTFDDQRAGNTQLPSAVPQPNHIHAIIKANQKYAVYFDPNNRQEPQYEWYKLDSDPMEINNLATQSSDFSQLSIEERLLRAELAQTVADRLKPVETTSYVKHWTKLK